VSSRAGHGDATPSTASGLAATRIARPNAAAAPGGGGEATSPGAPAAAEPGLAPSTASRLGLDSAGLTRPESPPTPGGELPVDEVPARIVRTAEGGGRQLQVRLVPAELGRLDIRLDFDGDKGLRIYVRADNDQTLELLQRHGHQLERALQQSGFDIGRDAIRYDLDQSGGRFARGGGSGGEGAAGGGRGDGAAAGAPGNDVDDAADEPGEAPSPGVTIRNVLDLHA
jgi:hypothetical protein